jgi:hypothetical protein
MSDSTPYERLGVSEDASFEEVRDARDRLMIEMEGNELQQELVEAAYDAVLMDRLRARQEGKIKVPDRIRFPERLSANLPTSVQTTVPKGTPSWLSNVLDNPNRQEILTSAGVFAGWGVLSALVPTVSAPTWLAGALISSIYFLSRKQNQFGRSVLIAFGGLIVAVIVGSLIAQLPVLASIDPTSASRIPTLIMLLLMWLVTCFLR